MEARSLNRQAPRLRLSGARVLLYHAVGERVGGNPRYSVSRAQLAGHLEQIRRGGHPILPLARVYDLFLTTVLAGLVLTIVLRARATYRDLQPGR